MASSNNKTVNWCGGCNSPKEKTAFIASLNPIHNKHLPICRSCLYTRFRHYKEATGSEGAALWCVCMEMGYPMLKQAYEIALKIQADKKATNFNSNLFTTYHSVLKDLGVVIQGVWQSDMELSDFIDMGDKMAEDKAPVDYMKLERTWGKFEATDYDLLEEFFNMYTKDIETDMDTAMELRYRDLCKAELRKRKADESGDIGEITKAEESLRKNMALLKLDKFQDNKQTEIEKHIERTIWMNENTEPAECRELDKYKDFSGFGIKWDEIMRCVKNLIAGTREYPDVTKDDM